jgi:uncharacterized protein YbbK (DUF523 family)
VEVSEMIIVSSCLDGRNTAYDGSNFEDERITRLVAEEKAIPLCCEQLGGLTTPRDPQEIRGGTGRDVWDGNARVITVNGKDTTEAYFKGGKEILRIAELVGAQEAILKTNSPSCGCGWIWDGTFTETPKPGDGVTTALLKEHGISVRTANEL